MQWGRKQRRSEGVVYHRPDRPSFPLPNPNGAMTRAVTGRQEEIRVRAAARAHPAARAVVVANHPVQVGFLAAAADTAADTAAASSVAQAEPVSTSEEERLQLAAECLCVMHDSPVRPPDSKCACSFVFK